MRLESSCINFHSLVFNEHFKRTKLNIWGYQVPPNHKEFEPSHFQGSSSPQPLEINSVIIIIIIIITVVDVVTVIVVVVVVVVAAAVVVVVFILLLSL